MRTNRPEKLRGLALAGNGLKPETLLLRHQKVLLLIFTQLILGSFVTSTCSHAAGSGPLNSSFHPAVHCTYLSTFRPRVWWLWSHTVCLGYFKNLLCFTAGCMPASRKREKPAFDNFPYLLTRQKHTKWHTGSTNFVVSGRKTSTVEVEFAQTTYSTASGATGCCAQRPDPP